MQRTKRIESPGSHKNNNKKNNSVFLKNYGTKILTKKQANHVKVKCRVKKTKQNIRRRGTVMNLSKCNLNTDLALLQQSAESVLRGPMEIFGQLFYAVLLC